MNDLTCEHAKYLYGSNQGDIICTANHASNVCTCQLWSIKQGCYIMKESSKCERRSNSESSGTDIHIRKSTSRK